MFDYMHNNNNYQGKMYWNKALTFGVGSIQLSFRTHCVHLIHAKVFSFQMLLHFSQIALGVCTLVLFICDWQLRYWSIIGWFRVFRPLGNFGNNVDIPLGPDALVVSRLVRSSKTSCSEQYNS